MKLSPNLNAVIFDLDGTIVDNIAYHTAAWLEFFRKYSLPVSAADFKNHLFGKNNDAILRKIFHRRLTRKEIAKFAREKEARYRKLYAPHVRPIKGFTRFLARTKKRGLKTAVASCAPAANRHFLLKRLGLLKQFDTIVGDEDITNGKPHPEIFLKTAAILGVRPDRCLVFEDSPSGVTSAKRAGMKVVGLLTGYPRRDLKGAHRLIKDFTSFTFPQKKLNLIQIARNARKHRHVKTFTSVQEARAHLWSL